FLSVGPMLTASPYRARASPPDEFGTPLRGLLDCSMAGPPTLIRSDCPGLPDASDPTTAGGWRLSVSMQSCKREVGSLRTIQESKRPRDHFLQFLPTNKK